MASFLNSNFQICKQSTVEVLMRSIITPVNILNEILSKKVQGYKTVFNVKFSKLRILTNVWK